MRLCRATRLCRRRTCRCPNVVVVASASEVASGGVGRGVSVAGRLAVESMSVLCPSEVGVAADAAELQGAVEPACARGHASVEDKACAEDVIDAVGPPCVVPLPCPGSQPVKKSPPVPKRPNMPKSKTSLSPNRPNLLWSNSSLMPNTQMGCAARGTPRV